MKRVRFQSFDGVHWGELEGGQVHRPGGMVGWRDGAPLGGVTLLAPCEPRVIANEGVGSPVMTVEAEPAPPPA